MRLVKMLQYARLVFTKRISFLVTAQMLPVAGEEDHGVSIEEASDSRVQHTRKNGTDSLIRQTKFTQANQLAARTVLRSMRFSYISPFKIRFTYMPGVIT
jgi:hypothetical protein